MKTNRVKQGRMKEAMHKFYFVRPRANANADELANRLIGLKSVEEVWLTDGDYGFVVKAKFFRGEEPKDVASYIARNIDSRFGRVIGYYQYSK